MDLDASWVVPAFDCTHNANGRGVDQQGDP